MMLVSLVRGTVVENHHRSKKDARKCDQQDHQSRKLPHILLVLKQIQGEIGQHDGTEEIEIPEWTGQGNIAQWEHIKQQQPNKVNVVNNIKLPTVEIIMHLPTVCNDDNIDKNHKIKSQGGANLQSLLISYQHIFYCIVTIFDGTGREYID